MDSVLVNFKEPPTKRVQNLNTYGMEVKNGKVAKVSKTSQGKQESEKSAEIVKAKVLVEKCVKLVRTRAENINI